MTAYTAFDTYRMNCVRDDFPHKLPMELFSSGELVKICAPMVRYSKLPFRTLVRKYNCDLAYTPMIIANSFVRSIKARDSDFTTNKCDRPLIVQFAANNPDDFADAAEIVGPYSDGIDLNCGCPQRWAMQEGYGACLIKKPDLMADIVRQTKARVKESNFTVSVKIRKHKDVRETVELCRQMEKAGVSWISVHGRTQDERCQPVDYDSIRLCKEAVGIPVVANGDIKSMTDAHRVKELTNVDGVMVARGILNNPAMFSGYEETPLECIKDWCDISTSLGNSFQLFHHHLIYMFENIASKAEKRVFNSLTGTATVMEYLTQKYHL